MEILLTILMLANGFFLAWLLISFVRDIKKLQENQKEFLKVSQSIFANGTYPFNLTYA